MRAYEKMVTRISAMKQAYVTHSVGYVHGHEVQVTFNHIQYRTLVGFINMSAEEAESLAEDLIQMAKLTRQYRANDQQNKDTK